MPADRTNISNLRLFFWYYLPPILLAAAILYVSSIPNLAGPTTSIIGFDKLAHIGEYGLFCWLTLRSITRNGASVLSWKRAFWVVIGLGLFAGLDEILQSFVPGRDSTVADFAADLIGILGATFVWKRLKTGQF